MWITQIELKNFQKHASLKIDLTDKVNIVHGGSDTGKSCFIRSLLWILYCEIPGDVVRKTGTKQTSVKITLDNGIQVERIKSKSINAYVLYKDGKEYKYDSIGKEIPEDIKNVLKCNKLDVDDKNSVILNVSQQLGMPFLLSEAGIFRMKALNKLTGNDVLDGINQGFNKDILRTQRNIKSKQSDFDEKEHTFMTVKTDYEVITDNYDLVDTIYTKIEEINKEYLETKGCIEAINKKKELYTKTIEDIKGLKSLDETKLEELKKVTQQHDIIKELFSKIGKNDCLIMETMEGICNQNIISDSRLNNLQLATNLLSEINDVYNKYKTNAELLSTIEEQKNKIQSIKDNKLNNLKELSDKYKKIQHIQSELSTTTEDIELQTADLMLVKEEIRSNVLKYKELLKEQKTCPVCFQPITEECLKEIKL